MLSPLTVALPPLEAQTVVSYCNGPLAKFANLALLRGWEGKRTTTSIPFQAETFLPQRDTNIFQGREAKERPFHVALQV